VSVTRVCRRCGRRLREGVDICDRCSSHDWQEVAESVVASAGEASVADPATADLLSAAGASPFAISYGPDAVVTRDAGLAGGMTVWLQNPFSCELDVKIGVGRGSNGVEESVMVRLHPLEVGCLSVPVLVDPHSELELAISSPPLPQSTQRARQSQAAWRLDKRGTGAGLLKGAAGLALFGVGRFSVSHTGGSTGNPLKLRFETSNPQRAGARIQYDRIWAPAGTPPTVPVVVHRNAGEWELTALGKASLVAVFIGVYALALPILPHPDQTTSVIVLGVAAALVVLCAVAFKFRKTPRFARPRRPLLPG
jgi:RNA polymerase subunit RPABC4/transcription elongation factor Spt4